jgi:hypothetical protein
MTIMSAWMTTRQAKVLVIGPEAVSKLQSNAPAAYLTDVDSR